MISLSLVDINHDGCWELQVQNCSKLLNTRCRGPTEGKLLYAFRSCLWASQRHLNEHLNAGADGLIKKETAPVGEESSYSLLYSPGE